MFSYRVKFSILLYGFKLLIVSLTFKFFSLSWTVFVSVWEMKATIYRFMLSRDYINQWKARCFFFTMSSDCPNKMCTWWQATLYIHSNCWDLFDTGVICVAGRDELIDWRTAPVLLLLLCDDKNRRKALKFPVFFLNV